MKNTLLIALFFLLSTISFGQKKSDLNNHLDSVSVFVSFTAETDGSISNIKIDKLECDNCSKKYKKSISNSAIRVVKEMSKLNKQKQPTKYVLPLKFKLED